MHYPADWAVGSCVSCADVHAPNVFVTFSDPRKRDQMVLVEHMADKPAATSADQWLRHMEEVANLNPRTGDRWVVLSGRRALSVITRSLDGAGSETVYVVNGSKTFSILTSKIGDARFAATYRKMLSTFVFR
jgi:hypothetical protein